jgi:SPP1 gp7 family putative phage head morphogenesis protein
MTVSRVPLRATANGRLLDAGIRHAIYVHRYGAGLVNDVVGFLNESVFPDLLGMLQSRLERIRLRGYDSGVQTTARFADMLTDTGALIGDGLDEAQATLGASLRDLAKHEADWAQGTLQRSVPAGLQISFRGLDLRAVQTVASQPVLGRPMDDWFGGLGEQTNARLQQAVGIGLAQGETVDQIVARVRGTQARGYEDGILQTTRRGAEAIVRTMVNHVSTQAREQTYRENGDVISGVQWVSTLDTRTTPICISLDGQVFPIDEGPRPPAHPNCRSTTVPVTKSWKELGIKASEAPESTRASMDGQVPESVTYGEWLDEQSTERQNAVLGPGKARLWRAGKIDAQDLATRTGRPATLAELQAMG